MTGSWKNLIEAKIALSQITNDKIKRIQNQINCSSFEEFQEFTFCQQLRFNFKILKRIVLEQSFIFLKFWDTTSVDLDSLAESGLTADDTDREAPQEMLNSSTLVKYAWNNMDYTEEDAKKYRALAPFMKESFPELASQQRPIGPFELNEIGKTYLVKHKKDNRDKLLTYIKKFDLETALNALFVLSEENQNLPEICQGLTISKKEFVHMAYMTLQEIIRKQYYPTFTVYRDYEIRQKAENDARKKFERYERLHMQLERD